MATTKITLASKPKADNSHTVNIRITHNRTTAYIPSNIHIYKSDFKKGEVVKGCKSYHNARDVNNHLQKFKLDINTFIGDLINSGEIKNMTAVDIRNRYLSRSGDSTLVKYANTVIVQMKRAGKLGNAAAYEQAINFLLRNNRNRDIKFNQLNYSFLKELETAHLEAGNQYNSLSVYLRSIRAIYNRAIKEGVAKPEGYPFKQYTIQHRKTRKRAIKKEDIKKFENYHPEFGSQLFHARNYFLFSFYMCGMNFSDLAHLKPENIIGNRIEYTRKKTEGNFSFELDDKPREIIDIYLNNKFIKPYHKDKLPYIFPIIEREEPEKIRLDVKNKLKTTNKYLRDIAEILNIDAHLSTYVTRHSWATIGKSMNVPMSVISEALGHADQRTTQLYLASLDPSEIDDARKLISG